MVSDADLHDGARYDRERGHSPDQSVRRMCESLSDTSASLCLQETNVWFAPFGAAYHSPNAMAPMTRNTKGIVQPDMVLKMGWLLELRKRLSGVEFKQGVVYGSG